MGFVKTILGLAAVAAVLLGFAGWRFGVDTPLVEWNAYVILGLLALAALVWGRLMGRFLMLVALVPAGIAGFILLFDRSSTWSDAQLPAVIAGGAFVIGLILYIVGSATVERGADASTAHGRRAIVCARCDQYLGTASAFDVPCPRCGSNRYEYAD